MPKIYRSMRGDRDGKPLVGERDLGVRTPPDENSDIVPDAAGVVSPGQGGMSVAPELRALPLSRIPKRLRSPLFPDVRGSNSLSVWSMGDGPFVVAAVARDLSLRPDPADPQHHGFVEPGQSMALSEYVEALSETRDYWQIDEEGGE